MLKKEGVKRGKEEREQANTQQEKKTKTAGKRAGGEVKEEAKAGPEKYSMAEIKRLESEAKESKAKLNNLIQLLDICRVGLDDAIANFSDGGEQLQQAWKIRTAALLALCRLFSRLLSTNDLLPPGCVVAKEKKEAGKGKEEESSAKERLQAWAATVYNDFGHVLLTLLNAPPPSLQLVALRAGMGLVAREAEAAAALSSSSSSSTSSWVQGERLFGAIVASLLHAPHPSHDALNAFVSQYVHGYRDCLYYTLKAIAALVSSSLLHPSTTNRHPALLRVANAVTEKEAVARRVHALLSLISLPEAQKSRASDDPSVEVTLLAEEHPEHAPDHAPEHAKKRRRLSSAHVDWTRAYSYKKPFTDAWISFLRADLSDDLFKRVLARLHTHILPSLSQPLLLADVLTDCFSRGGVVSVLALHGLFSLIQSHNLEYAAFYPQLYSLLEPGIFMVKYRGRFLRLLDDCLRSPLLPAYLVAAFIKRLARLALTGPVTCAALVLPLLFNLLRRHPACLPLVHRPLNSPPLASSAPDAETEAASDAAGPAATGPANLKAKGGGGELEMGVDAFRAAEGHPARANALQSSLWELQVLRAHYCGSVGRMACILDAPLPRHRPELSLTDAMQVSYGSLMEEAAAKKARGPLPLTFHAPAALLKPLVPAAHFSL